MPYVFRSRRRGGGWHKRWRFQYTDSHGRRRTGTGSTSWSETGKLAQHVQAQEDAIRKGWRPAPKVSDTPRAFDEVLAEYLAWGESQGGHGGHPWGAKHATMRRLHLAWWKERLGLTML